MTERVERSGLQVAAVLADLLEQRICPGTGIDPGHFWQSLAAVVRDLRPKNDELLALREELQKKIDAWHHEHPGADYDRHAYRSFLEEIGYLLPEPASFTITTENADEEVAAVAGPQLVVPVMNARYALNAANARWGSLYDALYGTDAIAEDDGAERGGDYNPVRGAKVIAWARNFLDRHFPLVSGSHHDARAYRVVDGALRVTLDGSETTLAEAGQLRGYRGEPGEPEAVLLRHNGLHVEIQIDANSAIGATDSASVKDLLLESAVSTIQDCEDSVAAVDADDKVVVYGN